MILEIRRINPDDTAHNLAKTQCSKAVGKVDDDAQPTDIDALGYHVHRYNPRVVASPESPNGIGRLWIARIKQTRTRHHRTARENTPFHEVRD
jgi:hypothetical protein